MLEKIVCIDNVGVVKKGITKPIDLEKVSLIYADNARGKSTLSSVLLACSTFDAQDLIDRKTIGALTSQKVHFRFRPGGGSPPFSTEFDGASWKGQQPNLHVFNQAFVDRNVYATAGVLPEQREALLNLALGDAAVAQRTKFDTESATVRDCTAKVAAAEGALQGYRGNFSVSQFTKLKPIKDVDAQIVETDRQLNEARASQQIMSRPAFKMVDIPAFNFEGLPSLLEGSFESISVNAEQTAKAHFTKHKGPATERWVAEGLQHLPEDECPFCGQETNELSLLKAYKLYFDGSYSEYQRRIAALRQTVLQRLGDKKLGGWSAANEYNQGLRSVWAESLGIADIPVLDNVAAWQVLGEVEADLLAIVSQKEGDPLTALDSAPFLKVVERLNELAQIATDFNQQIVKLNDEIAEYKAKLAKPDISGLEASRSSLMLGRTRFDTPVVALVAELATAKTKLKSAEAARDTSRTELDRLMGQTLKDFQISINNWLRKFAAPFEIQALAPTYRGGGLRSEYALKVRGATVIVGPGVGGDLSFHSALSEGDKRTLAFAFFLARLFADANRSGATVVLDDVFTSLDKHRRHNTVEAVLQMVNQCSQVIALGHDAHFLREVKRRVARKKLGKIGELSLHRDADDYSRLDDFDLDDYCSSEYYKHYQLVERFIDGDTTVSLLEVAKALRLLVEGHLHRCFPKKFAEGQTVGDMLGQVKGAVAPNPLALLHPLHAELVSFNEFAAAFHHDTSGGYTRVEINAAELLPFAKGALGFIQMRKFS